MIDQLHKISAEPQSPPPREADLLEALNRAVRHGRPDLARRLRERLTHPNLEVRIFELAPAAGGRE